MMRPSYWLMRFGWGIRLWAKDVVVALHLSGALNLVEYCEVCGIEQPLVWWAPNDLWEKVSGHGDGSGILCPRCFDTLATGRFKMLLRWHPMVEHGYADNA